MAGRCSLQSSASASSMQPCPLAVVSWLHLSHIAPAQVQRNDANALRITLEACGAVCLVWGQSNDPPLRSVKPTRIQRTTRVLRSAKHQRGSSSHGKSRGWTPLAWGSVRSEPGARSLHHSLEPRCGHHCTTASRLVGKWEAGCDASLTQANGGRSAAHPPRGLSRITRGGRSLQHSLRCRSFVLWMPITVPRSVLVSTSCP